VGEHLDASISKAYSRLKVLGRLLADRPGMALATPSVA
jgi:hypothetical protein